MADHIHETLKRLGELSLKHKIVAVGFSGGKDSLATLDLAVKFFSTVIPYYYYFIPGLRSEAQKLSIAKERYGLEVRQYPSGSGLYCLREGVFCDEIPELENLPDLNRRTILNWVKADTGATLLLDGQKKADGPFRRRIFANTKATMADCYAPLKDWLKWEVLSYLKANRLPIPDPGRGDNGSVSLMDRDLVALHRNHPEDYETLKNFFPYVDAAIMRHQWFTLPCEQAELEYKRRGKGKVSSIGE